MLQKLISIGAFALLVLGVSGSTLVSARADGHLVSQYGKIGSIDNSTFVWVRRNGQRRRAHTGDPISPGDRVETGARTTMTIRCSDGSIIVVGRQSKVAADSSENAQRTARLDSGTLRAIVSKINSAKQEKKKKFRFFIKTRSATIGVRGTDFVVSAEPGPHGGPAVKEELHTIEGTVEIARTEKTLVTSGGESVSSGQSVTATPQKITLPRAFDMKAYAQKMAASQPDLAVPEVKPEPQAPQPAASPAPLPSPKPAAEVDHEPSRTSLLSFEISNKHIDATNNTGLSGVELDWNPMLQVVSHWLAARGTAGLFWAPSGGVFPTGFPGTDFKVMASVRLFGHLLAEVGPSAEVWFNVDGATQFVISPAFTFGWELTRGQLGALDRIFISVSPMGTPGFYSNLVNHEEANSCGMNCNNSNFGNITEMRIGMGFRF